jgi:DNA-binding transcriptional ArsR family regulator
MRLATINLMTGINCIPALKALGELNRMRILRRLLKGPLTVNEIVDLLSISQYTVSKHLKVMREAGLLEVEKKGTQRLYGVAPDLKRHLKTNANVLDLGCCTFRFDKLPR